MPTARPDLTLCDIRDHLEALDDMLLAVVIIARDTKMTRELLPDVMQTVAEAARQHCDFIRGHVSDLEDAEGQRQGADHYEVGFLDALRAIQNADRPQREDPLSPPARAMLGETLAMLRQQR